MAPFWKKATGSGEEPAEPVPVTLSPSRLLGDLLGGLPRRAAAGSSPRVLIAGPPSGQTIETFHGAGCKVHVAGDDEPAALSLPDRSIDLVLGFDLLDQLELAEARRVAEEWSRVIRPSGGLFLIARQEARVFPPPWRADVLADGSLRIVAVPLPRRDVRVRQNREIEDLVRPLRLRDILLRREGLREILCRR